MKSPVNIYTIAFFTIVVLIIAFLFVYKPYFTTEGKIWRVANKEKKLEDKVLYYACSLPKDHKYHKILMKECNELEAKSFYESAQQDCSPDYMGGCN